MPGFNHCNLGLMTENMFVRIEGGKFDMRHITMEGFRLNSNEKSKSLTMSKAFCATKLDEAELTARPSPAVSGQPLVSTRKGANILDFQLDHSRDLPTNTSVL